MNAHYHRRVRRNFEKRVIPVTLIGGFLGSGKTTMVNYIAQKPEEARTDILVREFSPLSIDDQLIRVDRNRVHPSPGASMHLDEETVLYAALDRLHEDRYGKFDRLLLETSGAESPELFLHLFFLWEMPNMYRLDGLVTLVDAEYGELNLDEFEAAMVQVAIADLLVINKTDLTDEKRLASLEKRLRRINVMAQIQRTTYSRAELDGIRTLSLYDQLRVLKKADDGGGHVDGIRSYLLEVAEPLDKQKTSDWINRLFVQHGDHILRSKGFVYFAGEEYRYEFQAVRKTFHSYAHDKWKDGEEKKTTIVLIGRELPCQQTLEEELLGCRA